MRSEIPILNELISGSNVKSRKGRKKKRKYRLPPNENLFLTQKTLFEGYKGFKTETSFVSKISSSRSMPEHCTEKQ